MNGTLSSYAFLFWHQVRNRKGLATLTTWGLLLYVLGSVFGRFGVAFLGLAYNLEETPLYDPPLFRPNWANGTVNGEFASLTSNSTVPTPPGRTIGQLSGSYI